MGKVEKGNRGRVEGGIEGQQNIPTTLNGPPLFWKEEVYFRRHLHIFGVRKEFWRGIQGMGKVCAGVGFWLGLGTFTKSEFFGH